MSYLCFALRAKDCGHGANAREACLHLHMVQYIYIYISGHFHKARIRIFAVSIIIHFVSTLYVDMPILNWPSTQAIFWWGRGDPWSIDDRTSTNILYENPGVVPHGQFQGSAEKRFERARHGSITKNCCLPPTAYHIDFQCVTCPYDRSEYCKVL